MSVSTEIRVGVIPAGAMASAFAKLAADRGYLVTMYFHRDESLNYFNLHRRSNRLEGVDLPANIHGTRKMSEAVRGQNVVFLAPPSEKFPEVAREMGSSLENGTDVLIGSKGLVRRKFGSVETMSQVFLRECKKRIDHVAVMSGPTKAEQMALHKETGTVIAAYYKPTADRLQALLNTDYFRVYTEEDVVALEAWGALKNIMAFGAGVLRAQGVSDNTLALYFTRSLMETALIGKSLGVQDISTLMGLSGAGDVFLSFIREGTRNTRAGEAFVKGVPLEQLRKSKTLMESLRTVSVVARLVKEKKLDAPITLALNGMINEGWNQNAWIQLLMDRKPEREQFKSKGMGFHLARISMRALHNLGINGD